MGEEGQAAAPWWGTKAVSVGSHRDLDSGSPCCVAWANAPSLDLDFFSSSLTWKYSANDKHILIILFMAFVFANRTEEGRF